MPTPLSIWRGVEKLEPGTLLAYEGGAVRKERFWCPDFKESICSIPDAVSELGECLHRAVSSRLVSDVPFGVFLSGGLDSSAVAYYAAQTKKKEGGEIHTFSIGFSEESFDESRHAEVVAKYLDTIHHNKMLSGDDSLRVIPEIFSALDEPLADASLVPTYLLSRFAKEHVTVALGGDGGDELFAGYPTFQAEQVLRFYRMLPQVFRQEVIAPLVAHLPSSLENFSFDFKLKKFLDGAEEESVVRRHMRWLGTFDEAGCARLFTGDAWGALAGENVYAQAERALSESNSEDERNKLLFAYQRSYMMDGVLVKVDRASMQASLEVRAPFLDYMLVEFANRLPYEYKLRGLTTKYLLKKLMTGKLPEGIIHRKKQGFGSPIGAGLRGPLRGWAEELLSGDKRKDGLVDLRYPRELFAAHCGGRSNERKKLWNILVFLEWQKNYL